ncbi:MAG: glycine--tRNA ligase subunit beta [Pseudomonadota bacterium]
MSNELLLEIGTEEIPAAFISPALAQMKDRAAQLLTANRLSFVSIYAGGTPRRLTLVVSGLVVRQEEMVREIIGPPKKVAFDETGRPTNAAIGFARSNGVEISEVSIIETARGEYLLIRKREEGKDTPAVLEQVLPDLCRSISFPKSMRWGSGTATFARPVHWITAVYAERVVPFEFGSVRSDDVTYGHRFMAPGAIKVTNFAQYQDALRQAFVIIDPEERASIIKEGITRSAADAGGIPLEDEQLLQTVLNLVEYPSPLCGHFDRRYLDIPRPVLITSMREHQKYFAVVDAQGDLLPFFIAVSNTPVANPELVKTGNETVLRARLQDASFFFAEDRKKSLSELTEQLKGVIYHSELGTSYEKVIRTKELALYLAGQLRPEILSDVERAAYLCKADLLTSMVGEFPTLQGVMGREYALLTGEKPEIADAILEHYRPAFAGDVLPAGIIGRILSMADKMDTIAGFFAIGEVPSGTADPFGLRRHALAILNIILGSSLDISLRDLISKSVSLLAGKVKRDLRAIESEILGFFRVRYQNLLSGQADPDVIEAVASIHFDNVLNAGKKIESLQQFKKDAEFLPVSVSFKRTINITRDIKAEPINSDLLTDPPEVALYNTYLQVKERVDKSIGEKDYFSALKELAGLKAAIDGFFDQVMVMVDDERLRRSRLNLLANIAEIFKGIADFSKLQT